MRFLAHHSLKNLVVITAILLSSCSEDKNEIHNNQQPPRHSNHSTHSNPHHTSNHQSHTHRTEQAPTRPETPANASSPLERNSLNWKQILLTNEIQIPAFEKSYILALKERYPQAVINRKEEFTYLLDIDGDEVLILLHNAWNETYNKPNLRIAHCEAVCDSVKAGLHKDDLNPTKPATIIPVIKDKSFLDHISKVGGKDASLYVEPLTADLYIVYAEDTENELVFLTAKDIKKLKRSRDQVRALAIDNLNNKLTDIHQHDGKEVHILSAGNNHESSLILLDDLWEPLAQQVDGDIVIAIPSRGTLAYTGSNSPHGIAQLRLIVQKDFKKAAYLITDNLFIRKNGQWRKF